VKALLIVLRPKLSDKRLNISRVNSAEALVDSSINPVISRQTTEAHGVAQRIDFDPPCEAMVDKIG
jgi:hypothetical protein